MSKSQVDNDRDIRDEDQDNAPEQSGGVDLNAKQIGVGGNVIGRDEIKGDSLQVGDVASGAAAATGREAIAITANIYEAAVPLASSLHQLPSSPLDFTGREDELKELLGKIENDGVAISGLWGMAGIGKTVLAVKLAEQLMPQYPDAQIYLDLKGMIQPLSAAEAMAYVIWSYHPAMKLPNNENELHGLYRSVLHGQRALLVMDNAASAAQVEPLLPHKGCGLIITSRLQFSLPGLFSKNLYTLSSEDSQKLLLKIASRIGDQANRIAELCGHIPLALRLAGRTLAQHVDVSPKDYTRQIEDARERLEMIEAPLTLSYNLLDEDMRKLWCKLAVFPSSFNAIAAALVLNLFDADQAQASIDAMQNKLSLLRGSSLLEWEETTFRYHLHDLVRLFADSRLDNDERLLSQHRFASYYLQVLEDANSLYNKGGETLSLGLSILDREWANIKAGQAWASAQTELLSGAASLCSAYPDVGSDLLPLRQTPHERIQWLNAALTAAQRVDDHEAEAAHLNALGWAYDDSNESRHAIKFYEQALDLIRDVIKAAPNEAERKRLYHAELGILNNLGIVYDNLGEPQKAVMYYEQCLASFVEIGDEQSQCKLLANLGTAYTSLGQLRRAIEFYNRALEIAQRFSYSYSEATILAGLGKIHRHLGEPDRAIALLEQATDIYDSLGLLNEGNPWLNVFGLAYMDLGDLDRAVALFQQAQTFARAANNRSGEASALGNLGLAYRDLGETAAAQDCFEQQLKHAREMGDRRSVSRALSGLGGTQTDSGNFISAINYYEQALRLDREIDDRLDQANVLNALGIVYIALNDYPKAIDLYQEALAISHEIGSRLSEDHALSNLGNTYFAMGEIDRGIEFHVQRVAVALNSGDQNSAVAILRDLGNTCLDLNEGRRAIKFYEQALTISRDIGDRSSEGITLNNLGNAHSILGEASRAAAHYEQALVIHRETGDLRAECLDLGNLGNAHVALNQVDRAIDFYKKALAIARDIGDRFYEGELLAGLGKTYSMLQHDRRAIGFCEEALAIARELGDRRQEATLLNNLGNAYRLSGQVKRSIEFYEQGLAIARKSSDHLNEGNILWNKSLALDKLGKREQAIGHAESALKIFQETGSSHIEEMRKQLSKWHERSQKRWWQFWK